MLPKNAIDDLKEIFRKEQGGELSDQEATILANNLMVLFKSLIKPASKFEHNRVGRIDKREAKGND